MQSSSSAKETTAITEMQFHKVNWNGPVPVFDVQGRFLGSETPRIAENRKRSAGKIRKFGRVFGTSGRLSTTSAYKVARRIGSAVDKKLYCELYEEACP